MRDADPHLERDDLACMPGLSVIHVVGELEAFTEPEVAFLGIVGGVLSGELGEAFDVRGVVEADVLLDFGTTVCDDRGADGARGRRLDESMAEHGGDDGQEGCDGELHLV